MRSDERIWCPACDAGWVEAVMLSPGAHHGMLCAECEAFWCEGEPVVGEHFTQLSHWLKQQHIPLAELQVTRTPAPD